MRQLVAIQDMAVRVKPHGWPIMWGEPELEALSQASPADIQKAAELWRARAPKALRDLLDAELKAGGQR